MPTIEFTERELRALQSIYGDPTRERIDWVGFDLAKARIMAVKLPDLQQRSERPELEEMLDG